MTPSVNKTVVELTDWTKKNKPNAPSQQPATVASPTNAQIES
jgi:hypothetical protein